ncbi:hypothetical protein GCM10011575_18120 [Microlunatus endophyticus]|uniref:PIN domain-containing protein n=1 Tax=Microlunatus endophyticus TaxID=1716077 RepID=A0A917S5P2_9ACTN|nr:hypothetical protein GCM10011575_18120 [Microlunatus endophyticus]
MRAVDTSVIVAAFAGWHQDHASAAAELRQRPRVVAHALLEAYSVLTRLPGPHRAPPVWLLNSWPRSFPKSRWFCRRVAIGRWRHPDWSDSESPVVPVTTR